MIRFETFQRPLLYSVALYGLTVATTGTGIYTPQIQQISLLLAAILVGLWLFVRWRRGWVWHRTPMDLPFVLWGAALAISLLANAEQWRPFTIGLWYLGLYAGLWYLLTDLLANRAITRFMLGDTILVAGLMVVFTGYLQFILYALTAPIASLNDIPRPISILGNANLMASFLVVMIPLLVTRIAGPLPRLLRPLLIGYLLLTLLLLLLSYSRGGWLGTVGALGMLALLWLVEMKLLSPARMIDWLRSRGRAFKIGLGLSSVATVVVVLIVAAVFIQSFSVSGRTADYRFRVWNVAWEMFLEEPLTGYGLLSYRQQQPRFDSVPPHTMHSHAHNAILQVAGELGIPGLIAGAVMLAVAALAIRHNWRRLQGRQRLALIGATSAFTGYMVHQMFDFTTMTPALALAGLIPLVAAAAPEDPTPLRAAWRRYGHPVGVMGLWVLLLVTGLWSAGVNGRYQAVLVQALRTDNYAQAANDLQPVIDTDPEMMPYVWMQAMLYGMAAYEQDNLTHAQAAIENFERVLQSEPYLPPVMANLGGLYLQVGDEARALEYMQRAVSLAPESVPLWLALADTAEAVGDETALRLAWEGLDGLLNGRDGSGYSLHPSVQNSAQAGEIIDIQDYGPLVPLLRLLREGQYQAIAEQWENTTVESVQGYVVRAIAAHELGDDALAESLLARYASFTWVPISNQWLTYGDYRVNGGDLTELLDTLTVEGFESDYGGGGLAWVTRYLRPTPGRIFLPQVRYQIADPALLYLLQDEAPGIVLATDRAASTR